MRFLVLSDIHGDEQSLDRLDEEFGLADAVLFAGDFARFKAPDTALPVLNTLVKKHDSLFCVLGNCDEKEFLTELENLDVSVQGDLVFRDGLAFAGSGGGLRFTGVTPFERTEEELISDLNIVHEKDDCDNLILLIHHPPYNTKLDTVNGGSHVGSKSVRTFVETHKPLALISGHIHESFAVDTLGCTVLMNPGSLTEGRYGILEVERNYKDKWTVTKAELKCLPQE
ncbi:metallophosphoesterase [Treponema sp. OMZ 840]|uniref:metallophosphoesterase n=1 Tax=Treponema sp. OMZ 840 TaxID=244313 RepID=UPI003D8BFEED